jgi:hypothetical protein
VTPALQQRGAIGRHADARHPMVQNGPVVAALIVSAAYGLLAITSSLIVWARRATSPRQPNPP